MRTVFHSPPDSTPTLSDAFSDANLPPAGLPDGMEAELDAFYSRQSEITDDELCELAAAEERARVARANVEPITITIRPINWAAFPVRELAIA